MPNDYTATNPKTGEMVRWDGKSWVPMNPSLWQRANTGMLSPDTVGTASRFVSPVGGLVPTQDQTQRAADENIRKGNPVRAALEQFVAGSEGSLKKMGSDATSPVGLGLAAASGGESLVGKGALASLLKLIETGAGIGFGVKGAQQAITPQQPGENLPDELERRLAGAAMVPAGMAGARKVGSPARPVVRGLLDVGENFAKRQEAEHASALVDYNAKLKNIHEDNARAISEARQTREQANANIAKQNAEALADHQKKVQDIKSKYASNVTAKEAGAKEASATQSAADAKRSGLGDSPRSGPVFQRLQGMTNQVYGMVDNLQDRIRSSYNKRWRAFDQAIGDKQVDWTPVQRAVKDAEENILKGSPESIAVFRNIMKESPQLDEAAVFKTSQSLEATQNLKDVLKSANPNMRRQILANLHAQGISEADIENSGSSGIPGKQVNLPFADARGYFTELGDKLSKSQVPGDVYRAIQHVRDAVDNQITDVTKQSGQEPVYKTLKREYRDYKQNFDDPEAAIYQFDKLDTPEKRIDFLASGRGQNLIDSLSKYKEFGSDPNLPGRVRSLVRQIRDLPGAKSGPESVSRPSFPNAPEVKQEPNAQSVSLKQPPPEPEPLDVTKSRLEALEKMPKTWSQLRPYQAIIPYYWPRLMAQKLIGEVLSHPEVRNWIAGAK